MPVSYTHLDVYKRQEQLLHGVAVLADLQQSHSAGQSAQGLDLSGDALSEAIVGGLVGKRRTGRVALGRHGAGGQLGGLDLGQRGAGPALACLLYTSRCV